MVKLGPKIPPPTRREMEKLEKEQKRSAQLQHGFDPSLTGEPKANLAFLLQSHSKRSRSKRLGYPALEQAKRKWEKNRERTLARRTARALQRDVNTDISGGPYSQGSQLNMNTDVINLGSVISNRMPTMRNTSLPAPFVPLLVDKILGYSESRSPQEKTESSSPHLSMPAVLLSSFSPSSEEFDLNRDPATLFPSIITPRLDIDIGNESFWNDKNLLSTSSSDTKDQYDNDHVSTTTNDPIHVAELDNPLLSSDPLGLDCLEPFEPLNKSSTFAEPVDLPKHGAMSPTIKSPTESLACYSVLPKHTNPVGTDVNALGPPNFLGSTLSTGYALFSASKVSYTSETPRANSSRVTSLGLLSSAETIVPVRRPQSPDTSDQDENALRQPFVTSYNDLVQSSVLPSSESIKQGLHASDSAFDAIDTSFFGDATAKVHISESRLPLVIYPRHIYQESGPIESSEYATNETTIMSPVPSAPSIPTIIQQDVLQPSSNDNSFSSNMPHGYIDENMDILNAPRYAPAHISQTTGNLSLIKMFGQSVSNAAHTLAPAAPITQSRRLNQRRFNNINGIEKVSSENGAHSLSTEILSTSILVPLIHLEREQLAVNHVTYPDTPAVSRSGIAPPASTPTTKSPLTFAMTLPSPPWRRSSPILPIHTPRPGTGTGTSRGFVSALRWVLKKTFGYFWQRRS